ncbi:class I SAM-dependent rRNA methyltransferase [Arhodomonas sp. SL1]|uniref:class I SAM-dependent rRNA methyltransferase n=1 Tax=Arhodomonas sp. SL1 TaxID=3425691 RepID=UPI003F881921
MTEFHELILRKGEERRLRAGHLWVFSNEVDTARSPLGGFEPGAMAVVRTHTGQVLGSAYVNPHSLICARLISRGQPQPLDGSLLVHRLKIALALRERLFPGPYYRLVHGEGDGLPGLVVDRFGDTLVVQINTAGMEAAREAIVAALTRVVAPAHLLLRCDGPMRELEGLERYSHWLDGEGPETLHVEENGAAFTVPALGGQKTGWYYDHRANRAALLPWASGARVLDLFSYTGAWGIEAAVAGAEHVLAVDSSREACEGVGENAERNGVGERVEAAHGDVFEVLGALRADRERFDVVIADPPAFIKRRKDRRNGLAAYRRLNQAALQVLAPGGLLATASCSSHLDERDFLTTVLAGARHLDRSLQVTAFGGQGSDHPVHPAIPETRYIKAVFARMFMADTTP